MMRSADLVARRPCRRFSQLLWPCCTPILVCGAVSPALAAQSVPARTASSRIYLPQDFTRFSPRTALDLVQLVPGFVIADVEQRRGLGANGVNVLIDGRPVQGKATDAVDALGRITAARVSRLELSAISSSEVAGTSGQIVNVVLVANKQSPSGQFSWRPATRLRDIDPSLLGGDISVNDTAGRIEYSVGLRNDASRTGASGPTRILGADGALAEFRDDIYIERSDRPRIGADLRYKSADGSIFGLRGAVQRTFYRFRERSERTGPDVPDRTRFLTQTNENRRVEIAGDGEIELGAGRLKLIALHSAERGPVDTRVTVDFADGPASTGQRFLRNGDEKATALRSEYRWASGKTDWLVSAERAVTRLDNVSSLFDLMADGTYREMPLPGGSGEVRERRHDAAVSATHRVSPAITLQGTIGGEISTLELLGDRGTSRTFRRPKGQASIAWQATPRLNLTARIERRIGQISFFDFLASRNLSEERANQSNPDLVPPQLLIVEATARRDLGAFGSTTLRVYGQRIRDLVEQVPIGDLGEAPGNLSVATLYGVDWKSSLLLDKIGLAGARADARVQVQQSRVHDPVTGRPRRISNNLVRQLEFSVRHDIRGTQWAYGAGLLHRRQAPDFRVFEVGRYREGPLFGNIYAERKNIAGLTVRAGLSNLLTSRQSLDRFLYRPRRDGSLVSVERRRRSVGPILSLAVSGTF